MVGFLPLQIGGSTLAVHTILRFLGYLFVDRLKISTDVWSPLNALVIMHKLSFFPLGNADTTLISLENSKEFLFDFANVANPDDSADKRAKVDAELRDYMKSRGKDTFEIVGFTHGDGDHTKGSDQFFHFDRFPSLQGTGRFKIKELWVPAGMIVEKNAEDDARLLRQEARYRLRQGYGIRVFSRPQQLADWFASEGISIESRAHLITDAGQIAPAPTLESDGVEFFAHSPFGHRQDEETVIDRNKNCLAFQARFSVNGAVTDLLMLSDVEWESLTAIINITRTHHNDERLHWDVCKIPHHCSAFSLNAEKGETKTTPTDSIDWLYGNRGNGAIFICSSDVIPAGETTQPPHFQAANYYKQKIDEVVLGKWLVTMSQPSASNPKKIEIEIGSHGAKHLLRTAVGGAAMTGRSGPRVG